MTFVKSGKRTYKVSGLTKKELKEKTEKPKEEVFIKTRRATYRLSGLTVDDFCKKTGKSAKEYYDLTGKKEPVKKEPEKVKEATKKGAI